MNEVREALRLCRLSVLAHSLFQSMIISIKESRAVDIDITLFSKVFTTLLRNLKDYVPSPIRGRFSALSDSLDSDTIYRLLVEGHRKIYVINRTLTVKCLLCDMLLDPDPVQFFVHFLIKHRDEVEKLKSK